MIARLFAMMALLCAGCQPVGSPPPEAPRYEPPPPATHRTPDKRREINDRMERIQRELRRLQFLTEPKSGETE